MAGYLHVPLAAVERGAIEIIKKYGVDFWFLLRHAKRSDKKHAGNKQEKHFHSNLFQYVIISDRNIGGTCVYNGLYRELVGIVSISINTGISHLYIIYLCAGISKRNIHK